MSRLARWQPDSPRDRLAIAVGLAALCGSVCWLEWRALASASDSLAIKRTRLAAVRSDIDRILTLQQAPRQATDRRMPHDALIAMIDQSLRKIWAFKHSERVGGVPIHADFAAVNVNFFITPDDANLDPDGGGLVVWNVAAPPDWDFRTFNRDEDALARLVAEDGRPPLRTAHRQNRAVIFNSKLVHRTDDLHFKPGYLNRRINVTLLYGKRMED